MSVFFNGQLLVTPQTASVVNDDAMLNQNLTVGNAVAYLGESYSGQPFKVLAFGTPNQAKAVLGGGDLCDAVCAAFAPSTETGSPQTVYAVRVSNAQQPRLVVKNAGDSTLTFGTIWGKSWSNGDLSTRVQFSQGSTATLINITVSGGTGGKTWTREGKDVNASRVHINVLEDHCHFGVMKVPGGMSMEVETDRNGGMGVYSKVQMAFTDYPTLGDVADYLNTVKTAAGAQVFNVTFDNLNDRRVPSTAMVARVYEKNLSPDVTWTAWAIKEWFDTQMADLLTFELDNTTNGIKGFRAGPVLGDFQYLSTPPAANVQPKDWEKAFALLERKDVQWVCPVTSNPDFHIMADTHVTVCSNRLHKERRAIVGMGLNVQTEDALDFAKHLNSDRTSLVHLGHYAYDDNGKLVLRPAYMTAALVAGAFAGVNPGTPLTNKSLRVQGLEKELLNPTETDELLKGGVMPIEATERGYIITQSITTWLNDSKYNKREQSCGAAVDFTIRNVRQAVDVLRGQKQSPLLLSRAISLTKGALTELARPEPQGPGVLVGDENSPAWRNVTATIEGDVLRIQFEASPAIPNNYILVTMYAVPYSGSATA